MPERERGDGHRTIPYAPEDTRPYLNPCDPETGEVILGLAALDEKIREPVTAINRSGWVWTAESCEGHESGWSLRPEIRLVFRTADLADLLAAIYGAFSEERWPPGNRTDAVTLNRHTDAPDGWDELRVYAGVNDRGFSEAGQAAGIAYFNRLAARLQ